MEYLSKSDFFLKFAPVYGEGKEITDYILIECSENFYNVIKLQLNEIIGQRITEITSKYNHILGLEDYYFSPITKAGRKFELYNEDLETWYFINIYRNNDDHLLLIYNDITLIEPELRKQKQDILDKNFKLYR